MVKFVLLFLLSFSCLTNLQAKEKADFAMITKSFHRDLERSVIMYTSVEKYFTDHNATPFYFVIPSSEKTMFTKRYEQAHKAGEVKTMPIFIAEEEVYKKCGLKDEQVKHLQSQKHGGWRLQQVVKLCFYSMNLAKDYMSIDSDIYFVKEFDKDLFYKNGTLRTVARMLGDGSEKGGMKKFLKLRRGNSEQNYRYYSHSFIRYIFDAGQLPWYDFVSGFALWSSDALHEMNTYIKGRLNYNMADLINLVPWEMQWYGQFVQAKRADRFYTFAPSFVSGIGDEYEDAKFKHCTPTNGFLGSYGIQYQPHAAGRKTIVYTMPDTAYCKTKNFFRTAWYHVSKPFKKEE